MLKIFNTLEPFFKDNYRKINVREYARIMKISPPSASTVLEKLHKEDLLTREKEKVYNYFTANRNNRTMVILNKGYWDKRLKELADYIENEAIADAIVLFGSVAKLEITPQSDIDIAIITKSKKILDFSTFEKGLKRNIQAFYFESLDKIPKPLRLNIINGHVLRGYLK